MNRLRSTGLFMVLALTVSLGLAGCVDEPATPTEAPAPTATAVPTPKPEPTATPAAAAPEEPTSGPTSTPVTGPPQAATPAPLVVTPPSAASLTLVSSVSSFPAPPRFGDVSLFPRALQQPDSTEGLTVFAVGTAKAQPDEAYVVVSQERFGSRGPEPLSGRERSDIVANLAAIGIAEDDVEFETDLRFGPFVSVSVEVEEDQLPQIGEQVVAAVEEAIGRSDFSGLRASLSEEACDQARSQARREAISRAGTTAEDLAEALGIALGDVSGAVEYPARVPDPYSGASTDECVATPAPFRGPQGLTPLDAELPEIDVPAQLQISYYIGSR